MTDEGETSPFHPGERAIQERLGVREKLEMWGHKGIRAYMPEQHREFFSMLPTFFVAVADDTGQPWPTVLTGEPGFVSSPSETELRIEAWPLPSDPAGVGFLDGAPIGALGIQFHTRRRNRLNGRIALADSGSGFSISVSQSYGNCAQYIQAREPADTRRKEGRADAPIETLAILDDDAERLITQADTFFIATKYDDAVQAARDGLDMSHRGGIPGFVEVHEGRLLIWPDFKGNFFFNTLGNLKENPRCGLLFIDFEEGTTLQLAGSATTVWEVPHDVPKWAMAQRLVCFELEKAVRSRAALPLTWMFKGFAPQFEPAAPA